MPAPPRARRAVAVATAVVFSGFLLAAPPTAGAAKPEGPWTVYAGAYVKPKGKQSAPKVKTTRTFLKGLTVTVEVADAERRTEYLTSIDPGMGNLFPTQHGKPDRRLAFIVTLANGGKEPVVFNPGNIVLVTDKSEHVFPFDQTDLYMAAQQAKVEDLQRVLDRSSRVLFEQSATIAPGSELTRIVLFRALGSKWKQFQVHFSFVQIGSETHSLSFAFHKEMLEG